LGLVLSELLFQRVPIKAMFNIGSFAISSTVMVVVYYFIDDGDDQQQARPDARRHRQHRSFREYVRPRDQCGHAEDPHHQDTERHQAGARPVNRFVGLSAGRGGPHGLLRHGASDR